MIIYSIQLPAFICFGISNPQFVTKNINQWHVSFGQTLATKYFDIHQMKTCQCRHVVFPPYSSEAISFQTKLCCAKQRNKPSVSNATC